MLWRLVPRNSRLTRQRWVDQKAWQTANIGKKVHNRFVIHEGQPLLRLRAARQEPFSARRRGRTPPPPERDRQSHARDVLEQIEAVDSQLADRTDLPLGDRAGALVVARGPHLDDHAVARALAPQRSGSEVVAAVDGSALVRVSRDLSKLRAKAEAYATENTIKGNPKNQSLIARIETLDLATIADLSFGEIEANIPDDQLRWVEIWTRGGTTVSEDERSLIDEAVGEFAELTPQIGETIPVYRGAERDVHVVRTTGASLKALPSLLPDAAEVHPAPSVLPIVLAEAVAEGDDMASVAPPRRDAVVIAIHDSGIDATHPYVEPVLLGADSVVPGEPATYDKDGHGTQMAGIAAYSALASDIVGGELHPDAWLISVRLLESLDDAGGDPERGAMWSARTVESVAAAEALADGLPILHNICIGADNPSEIQLLDRTSWSIALDQLAWNGGRGRVIVVAAGNAEPITDPDDYPYINLGPPHIQQPGQAWNVLTVGGYTNLDELTTQDAAAGYPPPLAAAGELSPHSRTSSGGTRPIKPEVVMEAGNTAPDGSLENPDAQGLSLLTLRSSGKAGSSLLRRTCKTSPAATACSNALARIAAAQPALSGSSWQALLLNTARWPATAIAQMSDQRDLRRAFGYGVPDVARATASASNRPVMVFEGSLQPSRRGPDGKPDRPVQFIEIPLPEDELHAIGDATVTVAVTLAFLIEPTDNASRRMYAGGRLRWDLQGPTETAESFRARINRIVSDQGVTPGSGSYKWQFGADTRSRGTHQHDRAKVFASAIAGNRLLAVYPVVGWWEDSAAARERWVPYSIVVSVDLGEVDLDLYALTATTLVELPMVAIDGSSPQGVTFKPLRHKGSKFR